MRRTLLGLLPAVVMACAPTTRTAGPRLVPIDRASWQVRAAFDSAARVVDVPRMAGLFAEDGLLITVNGDSIRGRDAIAGYISRLAQNDALATLSLGREGALETCLGGGRERIYYTAHVDHSGSSAAVSGKVSLFWKRDAAGDLKIALMAFPEREVKRRLTRAECVSPEDSVWKAWRWAVSVFPVPALDFPGVKQSFEHTLRARGWSDVSCNCAQTFPTFTPLSNRSRLLPPGLVSVQYHLRPNLVGEIVGGRAPRGSTMGAQTFSGEYAQTRLAYSGVFVGALMSVQHWGLQVGVGPLLQVAHWSLRDSVVTSGGYPTATDYTWTKVPVGILGDVRSHQLLTRRVFLTFRAQGRLFGKATTPATPRFPPARIDQSTWFFGVGLGRVF
jgi:ketosteroid isomerase-like protein